MHSKIVLISFIVLISVSVGQGLKCLACEKDECDKEKNCPPTSKYCVEGFAIDGGDLVPLQDCINEHPVSGGEECGEGVVKGVPMVLCVCSTDSCNDGTALKKLQKKLQEENKGSENEGNNKTIIVSLGVVLLLAFKSFIY